MEIVIKDLSVTYKQGKMQKKALQNINLELKSPNFIGLLGPNGAGKSTFMKILVSKILPTSGNIKVNGIDLHKCENDLKKHLGYLPQSFGLYDELTVYQFLDYMAALKNISKNVKKEVLNVIEQTNLEDKINCKIKTLSGGQKQRVGIAQVLLGNPELIILDEPTVGLDPEERIKFRNIFSKYASDKIVLLSTHIIDDIQAVCNRVVVINNGKILFNDTSQKLIKLAKNHVGLINAKDDDSLKKIIKDEYKITSKLFTGEGISCRIIAKQFDSSISIVEPSLEDAYEFIINYGEDKNVEEIHI